MRAILALRAMLALSCALTVSCAPTGPDRRPYLFFLGV